MSDTFPLLPTLVYSSYGMKNLLLYKLASASSGQQRKGDSPSMLVSLCLLNLVAEDLVV